MKKNFPYVLVLGVSGMAGRAIYKYLYKLSPSRVFGTSRTNLNNKKVFHFDVKKKTLDNIRFENLINNNYKYFINCIGALRENNDNDDMDLVNSIFPKKLEEYCKKNKIKLIHISTDAVFSNEMGIVNEKLKPNPSDYYGRSKLKGEVTHGINIRTSILGFDPIGNKGLLERVFKNENKKIIGFVNQRWSGSTTLQLAQFIKWLISNNNFDSLSKKTNIIHFAPIKKATKYEIIKTISRLLFRNKVIKGKGANQTRSLKTLYVEEIKLKRYTRDLKKAFKELIEFDKEYVKTYKKN